MTDSRTYGEVHYFNWDGFDDEGELLFGYYWHIINEDNVGSLMGPYRTYLQAAEACQREWKRQCHTR